MKILCITDFGVPGAESSIKWLKERKHAVSVLSFQPPPKGYRPDIGSGIATYYIFRDRKIKRIGLVSRNIVSKVNKVIGRVKPDILVAFYITYYGWLAYLSEFRPYVIFVMNADINFFYLFPRREKFFTLTALKHADGIVSVSDDIRRRVIKLEIRNSLHDTIWVGADTRIFKPRRIDPELVRDLKIKDPRYVVFSPRAFQNTYNIAAIIKSIPHVLTKYPEAVYIVASYKLNTDEYERYLKELVKELRVGHAVRFTSTCSPVMMAHLYNLSRCFISVPSVDGTPASLHEGMASGSIPIVSALPTARVWVKDGRNGFVIKEVSPAYIGEAIIRIFRQRPEVSKRMSKLNIDLVKKRAGFNSCRIREERLYKAVIKRHAQRP